MILTCALAYLAVVLMLSTSWYYAKWQKAIRENIEFRKDIIELYELVNGDKK